MSKINNKICLKKLNGITYNLSTYGIKSFNYMNTIITVNDLYKFIKNYNLHSKGLFFRDNYNYIYIYLTLKLNYMEIPFIYNKYNKSSDEHFINLFIDLNEELYSKEEKKLISNLYNTIVEVLVKTFYDYKITNNYW